MRMRAALALALLLAEPVWAEPPAPGLMRATPGLPRSLPLVIRSPEGQAALVQVLDATTAAEVLVAYVPGGGPLRVLVPPGDFVLAVTMGQGWEHGAFIRETGHARLGPLRFAITGADRRGGHIVTLGGSADVRAFTLCQRPSSQRIDRQLLPELLDSDHLLPRPATGPGAPPEPTIRTLHCG